MTKIIYNRRSVRKFLNEKLSKDKIKEIIGAGVNAPSYCNTQDWRFIILNDAKKEKIVKLGGADIIKDAPLAIIVTYLKSGNNYRDDIQSASACIQNMLLKATSLGIGSCWVCHLPLKEKVRKLFRIPGHYEIVACVIFGYPKQKQKKVPRKYSYEELFMFKKKPERSIRNILKYFYIRQPFRPKIVENKFTLRFNEDRFQLDDVRRHWDSVVPIYDDRNADPLNPHEWRFIQGITYLKKSDSKDINLLSVWSRTGGAIPFIRTKLPNAKIHNFELSEKMIEAAKKKFPNETFRKTDLRTVDLEDNSMDYIMSPETLEHVPNPSLILKEFHRVLKPTGLLILSLPSRVADIHQWLYEKIVGSHGEGPRKGIPSRKMKKMLRESGFKIKLHKPILLIPIGPTWLIKFGNKVLDMLPFISDLGVMQFYICSNGKNK